MAPITRRTAKKTTKKIKTKVPKGNAKTSVKNQPKLIDVDKRKIKNNRMPTQPSSSHLSTTRLGGDFIANTSSSNRNNNDDDSLNNSSITIGALLRNMQSRQNSSPMNANNAADELEISNDADDTDDEEEEEASSDDDADSVDYENDENIDNIIIAENNTDDIEPQQKQQQEHIKWIEERTFESESMLALFMDTENCWSYRGRCPTASGEKVLYRCNRVKRMSKFQCAAEMYTIEIVSYVRERDDDESDATTMKSSFIMYRKNAEHNHDGLPDLVPPKVKQYVRNKIIEQFMDGRKPKKIFYNILDNKDIPMVDTPTHKQVKSVIDSFKQSNYGATPITMRQLSTFVEKHSERPEDIDEPFIIRFERSPRNVRENKFFRFFISTARLLNYASKSKIIHADGTHKVTTEKMPFIAAGVTDAMNKCHFVGATLANHETSADYALTFRGLRSGVRTVTGIQFQPNVLVCDADTAIHNGFRTVFFNDVEENDDDDATSSPYIIVMCYFHVVLNIQNKYKFQRSSNKAAFKEDVYILHLCESVDKFDMGCDLFVRKWAKLEPEATRLLERSFFVLNKNWYIGCVSRVPKHNNGMETFNSTMKRCQLEHQRQPLKQFLTTALSIVRQRSLEYLKGKEPYQCDLHVDSELMKRACQLNLQFVHGVERDDGSIDFYVFRAAMRDKTITIADVDKFVKARYKTFADFSSNGFNVWKITFPKDVNQWKQAVCTCPAFDESFICKHVISIANSIGLIATTPPIDEDFDDEPLFDTQRGRPKRTSKALVIE